MNYMFDGKVAMEFGVDGAIMLQNLYFWIKKNEANNKHYHDGRYWTYNSAKAFSELFPYWSEKQISRILTNLENNGAIVTGNYNKVAYDRTKWYALTDLALSIIQDGDIHFTKQGNGNDQTVKPIPDINTDSKPDSKPDIYSDFEKVIKQKYLGKKTKAARDKVVPKLLKKYSVEELTRCLDRYAKECRGIEKKYIMNESTFWNGRYIDYLDCNYEDNNTGKARVAATKKPKLSDF